MTALLGIFIGYGLLIATLSMIFGYPLVRLIERYSIGRWWAYTAVAAVIGGLLVGILTFHPTQVQEGLVNPHALTFSPWTRDTPGFAENPWQSQADFVGSAVFGVVVGGSLGFAFWYFNLHSRRT